MRRTILALAGLLLAAATVPARAQDPVKVDPTHYKVEFENSRVRVLRVTYGPREKSAMHFHPANVAVFLKDGQARFILPDGTTQDAPLTAGTVRWNPGEKHLPENVGDKAFEVILVELKGKKGGRR